MSQAFTLIEILIVVIIVAFIIGFSSYFYSKLSRGEFILEEAVNLTLFVLKTAREKSLVSEENDSWGVYLVNTSTPPDRIYIFKGNVSNLKDTFDLPSEITFYDFATKTILFQKLTGETTQTNIKLGLHNQSDFRWIIIPTSGAFTITSTQP